MGWEKLFPEINYWEYREEIEVSHSPIPKKKKAAGLNIAEAIENIAAGWAVRRPEWPEGCAGL